MKGYVGGLGASASNVSHIGQVGDDRKVVTDDLGESFTVCGFWLLR